MYDIILFDLDDTLLDFSSSENKGLTAIHQDFYADIKFREFDRHFKEINSALWNRVGARENALTPFQVRTLRFETLNKKLKKTLSADTIAEAYEEYLGEHADWIPGVKSAIEFLHEKGHILGVVTNGLVSVQDKKYERHELHRWFDCFVVSDRVNAVKPHRSIFDIALKEIANKRSLDPSSVLNSSMIMVGDSYVSDGGGAASLDIDFCFINKNRIEPTNSEIKLKFDIVSVSSLPACLGYQNEYDIF